MPHICYMQRASFLGPRLVVRIQAWTGVGLWVCVFSIHKPCSGPGGDAQNASERAKFEARIPRAALKLVNCPGKKRRRCTQHTAPSGPTQTKGKRFWQPSPEGPNPEGLSPEEPSPEGPSPEGPSPEVPAQKGRAQNEPDQRVQPRRTQPRRAQPSGSSPEGPSPEGPSPEGPSPEGPSPTRSVEGSYGRL